MKLVEKLEILQNKHLTEWLNMRQEVEDELSNKQSLLCLCGRLATSLHERNCNKFKNKIISETIKRLKHFLD
jgi:hypothetical protein